MTDERELTLDQAAENEPIRLSVTVSPELNNRLEEIARASHSTKSEILRRAIALMDLAVRAEREGNKLYVSREAPATVSREIVGIIPA